MQSSPSLIICFDFGLRNIGLAVGETVTRSARPLGVIKAKDGIPDWQEIEKLLGEYRPNALVVGLPLGLDGEETEMCLRARKFANRLHGRFGLEVVMQDERLSSKEAKSQRREEAAQSRRRNSGQRQQKVAALDQVDAEAAAIILNAYFSEH